MAFYVKNITPFNWAFNPSLKAIKKAQDYYNVYDLFTKSPEIANAVVAYAKGRMYDETFIIAGRSVTESPYGELIQTAPHIIESLMRNEVFAEVDLICSNKVVNTNLELSFNSSVGKLTSNIDDYYNGCWLYNITKSWIALVEDYKGSSKTVYVSDSYTADTSDKYKIVNTRVNSISYSSFDFTGGVDTGIRKNWKFAKSVNSFDTFGNTIQSLLFESFTILFKSHECYKIMPIFEDLTSVATLSKPMYDFSTGIPQISYGFTSVENLYNDFEINYGYEYGREEYRGKILIKDSYAKEVSGETFSTEIGLCNDVLTKYRRVKKYKYDCSWIQDDDTAILFAKKVVNLYTKQRLIVNYVGDIQNHIKYEIGDVVLINYPKVLPANKNNSAKFQIMGKTINLAKGQGFVNFTLIEV